MLREALHKFIESGAETDFSVIHTMSGCDLIDIEVECDCEWCQDDINYVEFDPFDTGLLRAILNELTRNIGNYEG